MCLRRTSDGPLLYAGGNVLDSHYPAPSLSISATGGCLNGVDVSAMFEQDLHTFCWQ